MRIFCVLSLLSALPLVGWSAGNSTTLPASGEVGSVVQRENPLANDGIQQAKKEVKGVVVDEFGDPVIGANVVEKGTTNGVMTDADGAFTLSVASNAVLQVSFIGYIPQDVAVNGKSVINVTLKEDTQALEEVVVIGYGTVKKKDLTGSVAQISPKAFAAQPVQGLSEMLRGNAPGVQVSESGTGAVRIRVRGSNSLNGSNAPLTIVDGVPGGSYSPNDVESIEILKDASATAIYGSRGANGVILVTTKRGKDNKPVVNASVTLTTADYPKYYDLLNASEYATFHNQYFGDSRTFDTSVDTDWQRAATRTGLRQNYQASVSGGSESTHYFVSGNYINNTSQMIGVKNQTGRMRGNFDFKLGKKFTGRLDFSASQSYSHGREGGGSKSSAMFTGLVWAPVSPIYDKNGKYNYNDPNGLHTYPNAVALLDEIDNNYYSTNVGVNAYFAYEIIPGLKISAQPYFNKSIGESRNFQNAAVQWDTYNSASRGTTNSTDWQVTGLLNYDKTFNKVHNLNAMLGTEVYRTESEYFGANATNIVADYLKWYALQNGDMSKATNSSSYSESALASFFARVNYNYNSKYYATVSFRADGSSKFVKGNQFSYFPSGALGWVLTEEDFLKDNDILTYLKLRASWGKTGSQAIGAYQTLQSVKNTDEWAWGTTTWVKGTAINTPANPDLRWETTTQWDLGADVRLTDKWSVSLDYYQKRTDDLLSSRSIPVYYGGGSTTVNLGRMDNKGFDFSVTYTPIQKEDLTWSMTLNGGTVKTTIIDLGDDGPEYIPTVNYSGVGQDGMTPWLLTEGERLGRLYGLNWLGLWKSEEATEAAKYGQKPGDNHYQDLNGDGSIDSKDYMVLGNYLPNFTWSYNTTLTVKNFDINVLIEGAHGMDMFNMSKFLAGTYTGGTLTLREAAENYWKAGTNENTMYCPYSFTAKEFANSSKWIENASYVKLRNISVGYTIPKQLLGGHQFRVSLSAQNLLTLTKYTGLDPEASDMESGTSDYRGGIDYGTYPQARRFTVGLNYTF